MQGYVECEWIDGYWRRKRDAEVVVIEPDNTLQRLGGMLGNPRLRKSPGEILGFPRSRR
jgi:hypothetical protein